MEVENWLPVKGYEGHYEVSDLGRVRSIKFGKIRVMRQCASSNRYLCVSLYKDNKLKTCNVHFLVAVAFLKHTPNGRTTVVNHINFSKFDNRAINLEIISSRENTNKKHIPSTSKYIGVHLSKSTGKWMSRIYISGESKYLGLFTSELEAHYAYQEALAKITQ